MKKYYLINSKMLKTINLLFFSTTFFLISMTSVNFIKAQCKPMIKIDGKATVVNENDDFGLKLPVWLKAGQTLEVGSSVSAISILEFTENSTSNSLEYSSVVIVDGSSTLQEGTVPAGKVWKIESVIKLNNSSTYKSTTFSAGSFTWKVPGCAEEICIEIWGAGGGGGGKGYISGGQCGGGGGGGGFGSQCFAVNPGDSYTIVVGSGGNGGNCSLNSSGSPGTAGGSSSINGNNINIQALGGSGGGGGTTGGGAGGSGGTCNALNNAQGANGNNGCTNSLICGAGGAGANGGAGGIGVSSSNGNPGAKPGGGGSGGNGGGNTSSSCYIGGAGADGKVIISW